MIFAIILSVLLLFVVNNHANVTVSLFPLPYEAEMPLFILTVLFFCVGMIMGGAMLSVKMLRLKRLLALFRKRSMALENELKNTVQPTPSVPALK